MSNPLPDEQRSYRIKMNYITYSLFLLSAIFTVIIGVLLGTFLSIHPIISFISALILLIIFCCSHGIFKKIMFYLFSLSEGLFLAPILSQALSLNTDAIFKAVIATVLVTFIALIVGFNSKSLSWMKNYLFGSLLGLLVLSLLNFVFPIPLLSQLSAFIFTAFIAYDINAFKTDLMKSDGHLSTDDVLNAVIDQFLNILNLFIDFIDMFIDL